MRRSERFWAYGAAGVLFEAPSTGAEGPVGDGARPWWRRGREVVRAAYAPVWFAAGPGLERPHDRLTR